MQSLLTVLASVWGLSRTSKNTSTNIVVNIQSHYWVRSTSFTPQVCCSVNLMGAVSYVLSCLALPPLRRAAFCCHNYHLSTLCGYSVIKHIRFSVCKPGLNTLLLMCVCGQIQLGCGETFTQAVFTTLAIKGFIRYRLSCFQWGFTKECNKLVPSIHVSWEPVL